jgi:hypothetical protein
MDQSLVTAADFSFLHDAELTLVAVDREESELRLGFRAADQSTHRILFYRVLTLRIDNLQLQNVVSRVLVSDAGAGFGDDLERVVRWTCSGSADALLISEQNLRRHVARVRAGELRLLHVEPSWGAEIGVIGEGFYLSEGHG